MLTTLESHKTKQMICINSSHALGCLLIRAREITLAEVMTRSSLFNRHLLESDLNRLKGMALKMFFDAGSRAGAPSQPIVTVRAYVR